MAGEMKLTYFNSRGRAELTRLLFKLAGKEFIDNRVEGEDWQKMKPSTPKGQLPVLEVDGKMMCESAAIARFVAREYNLYGANNWEAAVCDMVLDSVEGVFQEILKLVFRSETEEEKAEAFKNMCEGVDTFEKLVISLKKGNYILGEQASLADAAIYILMSICVDLPGFNREPYPTTLAMTKSFSEIPAIADWLKIRPVTKM